jgi:DNA-binding HxlR family transcriptional regulator
MRDVSGAQILLLRRDSSASAIREGRNHVTARAPADVSVLHGTGSVNRRSARTDLELIGNVEQSLAVLSGKWKVHLLFCMARGVRRHSRLLECLPGASKKVMTDSLRALERDGIVLREVFAEVPVRVEYSLTSLGWSMSEPLISLSEWGKAHAGEVEGARRATATAA